MQSLVANGYYGELPGYSHHMILDYLNGKYPTENMIIALTWVIDKVDESYLDKNPLYREIYDEFKQASIDKIKSKYGNLLPRYGVDNITLDNETICTEAIKCHRWSIIELDNLLHVSCLVDYYRDYGDRGKVDKPQDITSKVYSYYNEHPRPVDTDLLKLLLKCWPCDKLSMAIARFESLYFIAYHPPPVQAYLSGYPLHIMSEDLYVNTYGDRDMCISRAYMYNVCSLKNISLLIDHVNRKKINGRDSVNGEKIRQYSPFDIVRYISKSGRVSQLCRTEFSFILKAKTDPLTRENIPDHIIREIEERCRLAKVWNLPEPDILVEIYNSITRPIEVSADDVDKPNTERCIIS